MSGAGFCVGFPLSLIASSSFLKKKSASTLTFLDSATMPEERLAPDKAATKNFCLPLLGALLPHVVHHESKFEQLL